MGYPDPGAELAMLDVHGQASPLDELVPVAYASDVRDLIEVVRQVHVSPAVRQYAIDLVTATRNHPELRLGASPRATLHLVRAARAHAALGDRDFVLPDDLQELAVPALAHRLLPSSEAQVERRLPEQVVGEILERVPVPDRRRS
jgi:MoxR-like ATPase